jgi:hypothetical protein
MSSAQKKRDLIKEASAANGISSTRKRIHDIGNNSKTEMSDKSRSLAYADLAEMHAAKLKRDKKGGKTKKKRRRKKWFPFML